MKKAGFFLPFILLLLASKVNANETSVNVTSEGNSSATVNVQNSFNSTNSETNEITSHTKIRIESDGEVKKYESTNGEDVHIESSNGKSSVIIKNDSSNTLGIEDKVGVSEDVEFESGEVVDGDKNVTEEDKNFFQKISEAITNFFKSIFG